MDVGWTIVAPHRDLVYELPECVLKKVVNEYGGDIQHCLGVQDLWGNVYAIKSPFDIRMKYDKDTKTILFDTDFTNINESELERLFNTNENGNTKKYTTIQFLLAQIFSCDKQCTVTVLPPIFELEKNPMWQYIRLVSGRMNIYDWHRDVNFSFEWLDTTKEIEFKQGEVLFYVMFNSKNLDEKINIKKLEYQGEIKKSYLRCTLSRHLIKRGTRYMLGRNKKQRPKRDRKSVV